MSTTAEPPAYAIERPESRPVALGYASPIPQVKPPKPMSAAVVALSVGLLLLVLASFVLLKLAGWLRTGGLSGDDQDLLVGVAGTFGGACTVLAAVFLFAGLKWLGGIARSGG